MWLLKLKALTGFVMFPVMKPVADMHLKNKMKFIIALSGSIDS
jgi:hypothetical protein